MSVAPILVKDIALTEDAIVKIRTFLSGDTTEASPRSRASSRGSRSSLDADQPAGVSQWTTNIENQDSEKAEELEESWLGSCILATYSCLDYLLVCSGLRWTCLTRKPIDQTVFEVTASKIVDVAPLEQDCYITCCVLFGLGSTRMTEDRDCVIVAIGTSNGTVIFYTEAGILLFEETFAQSSSILSITLDYADDGHLFSVVTESDIFAVNAFSLHTNLLQSKSLIAKGEKTAADISETVELECSRILVDGGTRIKHAVFTGVDRPSSFNQYVSASLEDFNCRVDRSSLPNYTTFFANTERLFATFSWLPDGENTNIWTEAVSKITSSFVPHFGLRKFLGIAQKPARKSALSQTRQPSLSRSNINDPRTVLRLSKAPAPWNLIAVMDASARVVLVDVQMRQIVRIWKAYRDAQVAWVTSSNEGQSTLFLAVFAPRRALLEVWSVPNGVRVSAQHVDPSGFLLDGGTAAVICGRSESNTSPSRGFFVDSESVFHSIEVPFHLALVQGNTREQHDQLIIQKLPTEGETVDEFWKLYTLLKTVTAKRHAVLALLPRLSDPCEMAKLLQHLKSDEFQGTFEEIIKRADSVLHAYNLLNDAMQLAPPEPPFVDIPLGKESNAIIQRHLVMGDSDSETFPSLHALLSVIEWTSEVSNILERDIPDSEVLALCRLLFDPVITGRMDLDLFIDQVLPRLPFNEMTVASLFLRFVLSDHRRIGRRYSYLLSLLQYFIHSNAEVSIHFEKGAFESTNVSRGLLISTGMWIILQNTIKQRAEIERDEQMDANDSWEAVDPAVEHHDCTVLAAHAVWLLSKLHRDVSYSRMLAAGAGYFREQIAAWAVDQKFTFEEFCGALLEDDYLAELHNLMPKVTEKELLFAEIGWEFVSHWFKQKMDNMNMLQESITYLLSIKDDRVRHGVVKLVWDKFLLENVKSLSTVIEKTGRGPKEREAKQHLQMHDRQVELFLEITIVVLDMLLNAVRDSPTPPIIPVDHFLEVVISHPPSSASLIGSERDSLVHIASRQPLVNYHLVLHHQHLMHVYLLVVRSGIRIRPLSTIFCSIGQRAMFHPLDSHPLIPLERVDDTTVEHRHRFLSKIAETGDEDDRRRSRHLANEWNLTVEMISLVETLSHFRMGNDMQGTRDLSSVVSPELGKKLAKILAARVLSLATVEKTVLTASHLRFLQDTAGDEAGRVDWSGDWRDAVVSLAGVLRGLSLQDTATIVKIGTLTAQYWAISGE